MTFFQHRPGHYRFNQWGIGSLAFTRVNVSSRVGYFDKVAIQIGIWPLWSLRKLLI